MIQICFPNTYTTLQKLSLKLIVVNFFYLKITSILIEKFLLVQLSQNWYLTEFVWEFVQKLAYLEFNNNREVQSLFINLQ